MTLEERLALAFLEEQPADAARVLERLPPEACVAALRLSPSAAAGVLREMQAASAVERLSRLPAEDAGTVLEWLPPDVAVSLLRRLPPAVSERLLDSMPPGEREPLRRSLLYPEGTAGALMDPVFFALSDATSVAEARVRLRRAPRAPLHSIYVVDRDRRLAGAVDVPDLLRLGARATLASVMQPVDRLDARTPAAAVRSHPGWAAFHDMPVVDEDERLVGVIRYETIRRLEREAQAAGGAPTAHMTVSALGELFQLGLASFVEGMAAVSGSQPGTGEQAPPAPEPAEDGVP